MERPKVIVSYNNGVTCSGNTLYFNSEKHHENNKNTFDFQVALPPQTSVCCMLKNWKRHFFENRGKCNTKTYFVSMDDKSFVDCKDHTVVGRLCFKNLVDESASLSPIVLWV